MKKHLISLTALAAFATLSGCSLIPAYQQPASPVDVAYPQGEAYRAADAAGGSANQMAGTGADGSANNTRMPAAADLGWQDYFADPRLRRLIAVALENNRDLRVAALNMEAYRAQYRIQRADLFPQLDAAASGTRQSTPADLTTTGGRVTAGSYSVSLATTSWELDLFGRIRSLSSSALERYFGSQEAVRSTQIALVANVADAYLTLRADQALLKLTRDTLGTYERSYGLTKRSYDEGISSRLDLRQAQTSVETARASQQRYMRLVAQDENALLLLLGAGRMPEDLPPGMDIDQSLFAEVPAGLPSDLLRSRPDILSAEHQLLAANADIGAARAAFFPSITLTASAGTASSQLSGLFDAASGAWAFSPRINLPLFTAGALKASLDYAKIQKDINVATYERTIQTAFREVSDGLAARGTYVDQLQAQARLVEATQDYYKLADERFRSGVDNFLTVLDAQRQLFNAQQILIGDRLNQLSSEVNLYKALGGGWRETTAVPAGTLPGTPASPAMPAS